MLKELAELAVIDEGIKLDVKTLVIMSPTIYGIGSGVSVSSPFSSYSHRTEFWGSFWGECRQDFIGTCVLTLYAILH